MKKELFLRKGEILVIDPGYLSSRDGLELLKTSRHGDGKYIVFYPEVLNESIYADSGEVAVFKATRDVTLYEESGYSGLVVLKNGIEDAFPDFIEKLEVWPREDYDDYDDYDEDVDY